MRAIGRVAVDDVIKDVDIDTLQVKQQPSHLQNNLDPCQSIFRQGEGAKAAI